MNDIQKLIDRDIRAKQEVRRGTVLTEPKILNMDASLLDRTVFVVDVDIGATRPIRDVLVKSSTGEGNRAYAQQGKAVEIARNAGGRWIVIGSADRITATSSVQLLDESDDTVSAGPPAGFSYGRRAFDYYSSNLAWGVKGFGNQVILDADGNEVA